MKFVEMCRSAISDMEVAQQEFDAFILGELKTCDSDIALLKEMSNRTQIAEWFPTAVSINENTERDLVEALLSYLVGVVFGRWDVSTGLAARGPIARIQPKPRAMYCPRGQLQNEQGMPLARDDVQRMKREGRWHYPLEVPWDGILVDDAGFNLPQPHRDDIVRRIRGVFDLLWKERAHEIEQEACEILGVSDLRDVFRRPAGFFQQHLKQYSKSQRKAPIYWPLSTSSGSYTIWIYYHRLNGQTLYTAVNQYIDPKIGDVERGITRLEEELESASGRDMARVTDRLNEALTFRSELREFREELLRVAALPYQPNLNDGVLINAAPFHKLFRLRSWAKDTEECWNSLAKGQYEWAHLAYTIWPDRVREVCRQDRSIAIAHGLQDLHEASEGRTKGGRRRRKAEVGQ